MLQYGLRFPRDTGGVGLVLEDEAVVLVLEAVNLEVAHVDVEGEGIEFHRTQKCHLYNKMRTAFFL